jgi:lipopolysaccharide heptosyltransferase II
MMENSITKGILIENINKILVLQLAGIGDLVMATPTLKALRTRFKDAYIGLLVMSRSAQLIEGSPYIDDLFVLDIKSNNLKGLFKKGALINVHRTIKKLRKKKFDMQINLEHISSWAGALKMAFFFRLIGAEYRVGRDTDGKGFFLNFKVKENSREPKHAVEANLDVARALGANIEKITLEVPVFDKDREFVSDFLAQYDVSDNDLLIGINPGTYRPYGRWFKERWAQLANVLIEECGCKVIITGGESEREMINEIVNLMREKSIITATTLTLKQVTTLLKRLNLFITNDTGPMHIAAAMQTPLIALFGPGDIRKFSPYCSNDKCIVLRKDVDCQRPCYKFKCDNRKCMELITVDDVMKEVRGILV